MPTFTVTVTDEQMACLAHDIPSSEVSADIQRRLDHVISNKLDACKERIIKEGMADIYQDPDITEVPADRDALITTILGRSSYKDRDARDAIDAIYESEKTLL